MKSIKTMKIHLILGKKKLFQRKQNSTTMEHMWENLLMALEADLVFLYKMMVPNTKEIGPLICLMDLEDKITSMVTSMRVNFLLGKEAETELISIQIKIFILVPSKMITSKAKELTCVKVEAKSRVIGIQREKTRVSFTIQMEIDLKESLSMEWGMEKEYIIVKMELK